MFAYSVWCIKKLRWYWNTNIFFFSGCVNGMVDIYARLLSLEGYL